MFKNNTFSTFAPPLLSILIVSVVSYFVTVSKLYFYCKCIIKRFVLVQEITQRGAAGGGGEENFLTV